MDPERKPHLRLVRDEEQLGVPNPEGNRHLMDFFRGVSNLISLRRKNPTPSKQEIGETWESGAEDRIWGRIDKRMHDG